jgi:predicted FMN-binding regulatory protein PaiB
MKNESNNYQQTQAMPYDAMLAPVKFLVRQMNGIIRGELTLDEGTSKLYRNGTHDDQTNIRLELCVGASKHFKTDCYVSEVLNGC